MSTTAPIRTVTTEQVEAEIATEHHFNCLDAVLGQVFLTKVNAGVDVPHPSEPTMLSLVTLTFCVLVLKNGTRVVGINYGAIDPTVNSPEMARDLARREALEQARTLLAFRLRDQIAAELQERRA